MNGRYPMFLLIFCLTWNLQAATNKSEPVPDIRVAIDVSGSMKKNDPKQLRKPALKMLVGLMPDGMYSGVWTFGQFVNMQVKYGKVTAEWRSRATKEADKIHSRALYTNIEEAIQRASFNWNKPDNRFNRNLILLTDGKVDIARDKDVNKASRERIINHWLPRMKQAGVRIHSVALSSEVDRELLSLISDETGGWYEQVESADALQRVFLRLFEKSAPRDSLPIKGNRFHVDAEVKDMTLLVFHKPGTKKLHINTPKSGRWSEDNAPGHVTWYNEDGYDLVTVKDPETGDWILETESDPDNRVMIVTNMKLKTNSLPNHLLQGENLDIEAALQDRKTIVKRQDFLKLIQFSVIDQKVGEVDSVSYPLEEKDVAVNGKKQHGIFTKRLNKELKEGLHTLIIRADGATFQRELRHTYQVHSDIASITILPFGDSFQLRLSSNERLVDPESLQVTLMPKELNEIQWHKENHIWSMKIPKDMKEKTLTLDLTAKRRNGNDIHKNYSRQVTGLEDTQEESTKPVEKEKTSDEVHTKPGEHDKGLDDKKSDKEKNDEPKGKEGETKSNWVLITWLFILVNLIVLIVGILGWMVYKKRKEVKDEQLENEMDV